MTAEELNGLFDRGRPGAEHARLAESFLAIRGQVAQGEACLKLLREHLLQAEQQLLLALDASGLKSLTLPGGETLAATSRSSYTIPAAALEDPQVFLGLLRAGGRDLVRRHVDPRSFSAFCRKAAKAGRHVHPAVKVFTRRTVSVGDEE
jgi:hypothetical protein